MSNGDLISRKALKEDFKERNIWNPEIISAIDNAPTVAYPFEKFRTMLCGTCQAYMRIEPERQKGEWIKVVENLSWHYECNQCHNRPLMARLVDEDVLSDFCPNCGAEMVIEATNEE